MLKGRSESELAQALKYGFQQSDLETTRDHWEPLLREAGLYGVLYSTQDSFDECRTGADFLAKHNPSVKVMVAGKKCSGCIYNKISRCLMYGKPLVTSTQEIFTQATAEQVLSDYKAAGRIPPWDNRTASSFGPTHREALKAIHQAASLRASPDKAQTRMEVVKAYHGGQTEHAVGSQTRLNIVKTAARFLNEGLYGQQLLSALKARFDTRDLVAARNDLRPVLAEQGLQGIYYVDPMAYDDYGRGCKTAADTHRNRLVEYVKLGPKCASCVHQSRQGFCSVINKPLVVEPPYFDKQEQQRQMLASGDSTSIPFEQIVNNGMSMMAEYELQNEPIHVEVAAETVPDTFGIQFGNAGQGIKL